MTDNGTDWVISRQGITVNLPKQFTRNGITFNVNYQFLPDRIIPSIQIDSYALISNFVVKVNSTVWYLPFPWSASQVRSVTDDLIDMGVFKRTTSITVLDSNTTPNSYQVVPKVVGNNIRLYFNPTTYSGVVYPLTLTENTITVSNATTAGFTSSNVSFDGVRWTDSGQIAINLRNDSQANMTGLVGYWSMDENTGTLVHQVNTESGLVNTTNQGTWYGNTTLNYTTGQIGNALAFDGVNDYVNAGNEASLGVNVITIAAWVKPTGTQLMYAGIVTRGGSSSGYIFRYSVDSSHLFVRIGNGTTTEDFTANSIPNIGSWSHIVFIYNSSNYFFYINGVNAGNGVTILKSIATSTSNFYIGIDEGIVGRNFGGSIDEVRIYNRALSASEISVLYNTSMRTQGNVTILNQSASAGNVINRTRIVYTGQDSINNASIYARQNGTSNWDLIQSNATSNTWYSITNQYQNSDFRIQLNGNGSNTPFFTSLEWDECLAYVPTITSWSNNFTNDQNISITIPKNNSVLFNTTTDIFGEWHWTGANYSSGNGTINSQADNYFDSMGVHIVSVYASNVIGNSNTITWTVTVLPGCCFNISGYVSNVIELPLENTRVDFNNSHVFTDAIGYYEFTGIEEGTYPVLGRAIGYRNHTETLDIAGNTTKNITMNERTFGTVTTPGFSAISGIFILALTLIILRRKK